MAASESEPYRLVIDRIEGDLVVVELDDGRTVDLPRWMLPPELRDGDVIVARAGGGADGWRLDTHVDEEETARRRAAAKDMIDRLRERDPGGDITL